MHLSILKLCLLVSYLLLSNTALYEIVVLNAFGKKSTLVFLYASYFFGFSLLFVYFSLFSQGVLKAIVFVIFIVSGICGQYYWATTGFPITIDAIEMALINIDRLGSLAAETPRSMIVSIGTATLGLLGALLPVRQSPIQRLATKRTVRTLALGMAVVMFLGTSTIVVLRNGHGMGGMPVQVSSLFPLPITQVSPGFTRKDHYTHKQDSAASVVVVIDESVSFHHFRMVSNLIEDGTLPPISRPKQNMPILKSAKPFRSMHNCSAQSVWAIINGLTIQNGEIILAPSLWQRAKGAGYQTIYISAQEKGSRYQYFQTPNDISLMDEQYFFGSLPDRGRDRAALSQAMKSLRKDEKVFIFLIKSGSHFPYKAQISRGEVDQYSFPDKIRQKEREYLTSIYRNTFHFLASMLTTLTTRETMVFYTSDHGQNLHASGFPHCNSREPHRAEWEVPLLTYNVPPEIRKFLTVNSRLHGSILGAMGYALSNGHSVSKTPKDLLLFGSVNTRLGGRLSQFVSN